ncbi:peptidylprolyl isomerase [Desulfofalx alkaliphila]|uniref:peptidylprolyl isomerase n=1 Tax=Desulfofalx alkaliphila TaxID=105483 RepID=UPI0004E26226|nr:peptidylprolyl isomerase [Desulfofalx alkaliphila]
MKIFNARRLFIICMAVLLLITVGCGQKQRVAATVNGEEISMELFDKRLALVKENLEQQGLSFESDEGKEYEATLREQVLNELIDAALIRQQAEAQGVLPTEDEINKEIEAIKASYPSEKEYKKALNMFYKDEGELYQDILTALAMENLYQKITEDVKEISEEQVREYYQQNKAQFTTPEQLEVRHILFYVNEDENPAIPVQRSEEEAKALAVEVIEELNQGREFAQLAQEKSEDTGTKEEGGIYVFSPQAGMTDPDFARAAANLSKGEYTKEPVRSQFGYHVIKLDKVVPAKEAPFEEVRALIETNLFEQSKQEFFVEFMDDVRDKAEINKEALV